MKNLTVGLSTKTVIEQLHEQLIPEEVFRIRKLEDYEVSLIDISTGETATINTKREYLRITAKGEKPPYYFVGAEIELNLTYDIWGLRETKWKLDNIIKYKLMGKVNLLSFDACFLNLPESWTSGKGVTTMEKNTLRFVRHYIKEATQTLFNTTCPILYKEAHPDATGIECTLIPCTFEAYKLLENEFKQIFETYLHLGYTDLEHGAGVHTYLDYRLFGENKTNQHINIKKFLWFLFHNGYHMSKLSQRLFGDTVASDIYFMLGDHALIMTEEEIKTTFIGIKDSILESFISGRPIDSLNLVFNKVAKTDSELNIQAIEYRWWAATSNYLVFLAYIEFCFAIVEYLPTLTEENEFRFSDFSSFVNQSGKYLNLTNLILKLSL